MHIEVTTLVCMLMLNVHLGASKPGWNGIAGRNRVIQASRWYWFRIRVAANVKCFVDDTSGSDNATCIRRMIRNLTRGTSVYACWGPPPNSGIWYPPGSLLKAEAVLRNPVQQDVLILPSCDMVNCTMHITALT